MMITDEKIKFLHRFFDKIFDGIGDCLYVSDCETCITDLITSRELRTVVDYSQIESGEFEGIKFNGYFGCTKAVFAFEGWDIVIKIPFTGDFCYGSETDELVFNDIPNHIVIEDEIYREASDEMKKILLKNEYLFNYNNLEIYSQQAIAQTESERPSSTLTKELADKVKSVRESREFGFKIPYDRFLATIIIQHPDTFENIMDELCDLEDMHSGNYGYLANGMAVIHDYAGFSDMYY